MIVTHLSPAPYVKANTISGVVYNMTRGRIRINSFKELMIKGVSVHRMQVRGHENGTRKWGWAAGNGNESGAIEGNSISASYSDISEINQEQGNNNFANLGLVILMHYFILQW